MTEFPGAATPPSLAGSELLARLSGRSSSAPRYADAHEIARGGMGAILEVRDLDLRRKLAMKVMRERGAVDRAQLQRFLEEAQVTAQLDHPGVVPVHELGIDAEGRIYFTMALVRGCDLEHVFDLVRRAAEGWTRPRALEVLLKVCDTLAFAHAQGVIHRDLKPANVMVGSFGEVYVMDWGLAKLVGATPAQATRESVSSERREATAADGESSLATQDGAIVGTPSYMSPEQARGEPLDVRADVYSLGAMLYTLCAGRAPYGSPNVKLSAEQILSAILKGPPARLEQLAREVAPELLAICDKAMAREREQRYQDVRALAEDLRRYVEGRVVRAYRTGAWVEFKKWVLRNKGMASALAGVVLALLAGAGAYTLKESQRADVAERALRLADGKIVVGLEQMQQGLWPAVPEMAPKLERWVQDAREVLARRAEHRQSLARSTAAGESATQLEELLAELDKLEALVEPVERRAKLAASLRERTVDGPDARARWEKACAAVAASPRYAGLKLKPQLGLLPLEADPRSGLWEFWHVASGSEPRRGDAGAWKIEAETAIVLVLLPGGAAPMGSNPPSAGGSWSPGSAEYGQPWIDPLTDGDETFFDAVELDPYLISKYETTQAQWIRAMGVNPSQHNSASSFGGPTVPVDDMDWYSACTAARRFALALPTEAQWERASRGGTATIYPEGSSLREINGRINLQDKSYFDLMTRIGQLPDDPRDIRADLNDGFGCVAPVGALPPNPFGLHEILGNVWEWCEDTYELGGSPRAGDGLRGAGSESELKGTIRGGAWSSSYKSSRPANRMSYNRQGRDGDLGVRFVRRLQP